MPKSVETTDILCQSGIALSYFGRSAVPRLRAGGRFAGRLGPASEHAVIGRLQSGHAGITIEKEHPGGQQDQQAQPDAEQSWPLHTTEHDSYGYAQKHRWRKIVVINETLLWNQHPLQKIDRVKQRH